MKARMRRWWQQLLLPASSYDPLTDCYLVPVSAQLVDAAADGWSQPLQAQFVVTPTAHQFGGTDVQLHLRAYDPAQSILEELGLS